MASIPLSYGVVPSSRQAVSVRVDSSSFGSSTGNSRAMSSPHNAQCVRFGCSLAGLLRRLPPVRKARWPVCLPELVQDCSGVPVSLLTFCYGDKSPDYLRMTCWDISCWVCCWNSRQGASATSPDPEADIDSSLAPA